MSPSPTRFSQRGALGPSVRVAVTLYSPTRPFGVHARSVSALDFRLECRNMQRLRDEGNQVSHPHKPAPDPSARKNERGPGTAPSPCLVYVPIRSVPSFGFLDNPIWAWYLHATKVPLPAHF